MTTNSPKSQYAIVDYKDGGYHDGSRFEATLTLNGEPLMIVANDGNGHENTYTALTLEAEDNGTHDAALAALDAHAKAWVAQQADMLAFEETDAFINHLVETSGESGGDDEAEAAAIRRYIGKCLVDEWQMAASAGHGYGHEPLGYLKGQQGQPSWTALDFSNNVRPSYDARFVDFYSPDRIEERLYTLAKIVEVADLDTLLIIVQDFANHSWAERLGWKPEWKRDKPKAHTRYIGDAIKALAGERD